MVCARTAAPSSPDIPDLEKSSAIVRIEGFARSHGVGHLIHQVSSPVLQNKECTSDFLTTVELPSSSIVTIGSVWSSVGLGDFGNGSSECGTGPGGRSRTGAVARHGSVTTTD